MAQAGWWVHQFQEIEKKRTGLRDPARAAQLLDQGHDCMAKSNVPGLQNIVRQLWDLQPREVVEAAQRGYDAGLGR